MVRNYTPPTIKSQSRHKQKAESQPRLKIKTYPEMVINDIIPP